MWALRILSHCPLSVLYILSEGLAFFTFHVMRYRRKLVEANLSRAFPDKSDAERRSIAKNFYRNLCDYAVETLKILTISPEEITKRMVCTTPEVEARVRKEPGASVYLTAHHFNWEWLLCAVCLRQSQNVAYVYQPQSSRFFDDFSNSIRQRFGARGIRRDQVGREVIRMKGSPFSLCILADQFPGLHHDKRYWTEFLHQETAFFSGSFQLAVKLESSVYFFQTRKVRRGYYEYAIIPIDQFPYRGSELDMVTSYATEIAKAIQVQPENWLWSHNRWKRSRKEMGE